MGKFKKVKLNYVSAIAPIEPVATIPVSSAELEKLNMAIRKKTDQNRAEYNAGIEYIESHPSIYGSNNLEVKTGSLTQNKRH